MAVVVSGEWATATPVSKNELVTQVTQVYGVDGDDELRQVATGFINSTIKDMNSHLYEFMKLTLEGIELVAGQRDYDLPSGVYRESLAYIHHTDNDQNEPPLSYIPWVHFQRTWGSNRYNPLDIPLVYSMRNVHGEGKLTLAPSPSTGIADDYTMTLEYYRRIPVFGDGAEESAVKLDVPQEVEVSLVYGAQKRLAIHLHGPGHPDVAGFDILESKAVERLKAVDKRHPDQKMRFHVSDFVGNNRIAQRGVNYIRVK